jgi:hypothetical protein
MVTVLPSLHSSHLTEAMLIYQPKCDINFRIAWYGGESTKLHYEQNQDGEWTDIDVRTLGGGIPTGVKELLHEMQDYYDYCITMAQDNLYGTIF